MKRTNSSQKKLVNLYKVQPAPIPSRTNQILMLDSKNSRGFCKIYELTPTIPLKLKEASLNKLTMMEKLILN